MILGERVAELRKVAGMAQVELAVAIGDRYNQQMISHIENGHSGMRVEGLVKLAEVFDVSTDYLLGLTNDPTPTGSLTGERDYLEDFDDVPFIETDPQKLGGRLADACLRAGLSRGELSAAMGRRYNQQTLSEIEAGRRSLRFDGLVNAARALEVSTDYLLGLTEYPMAAEELAILMQPPGAPPLVGIGPLMIRGGPVSDTTPFWDDPLTGLIWFNRSWLERNEIDPNRASVTNVVGDSMEPTLTEGSTILVDHRRKRRRQGPIFLIQNSDEVLIRRAALPSSRIWHMVSDNPDWSPVPWPSDAEIIGEVRWAARTF